MIITCEKCQTRFKVGDDKLAQGPIRVRCSKCNHIFMASAQGALVTTTAAPNNSATQPPTMLTSMPPSSMPPFSMPPMGPTAVHQPFQPPSAASEPPGAAPRSGIFRSPAMTGSMPMAPPATMGGDPFAGQQTVAASPRALDPFGLGASAPSPRASTPWPTTTSDPFAGLGVSSAGARALETPGAEPARAPFPRSPSRTVPPDALPLARPPTKDPFAGLGGTPPSMPRPPSKDPFAGIGAAPPSTAIDSARGRPPLPDPFGASTTAPPGSSPRVDPFAGLESAPPPPPPALGMIPQPDPFAPRDSGAIRVDDADVQELRPQSSAPFDSDDPFGSLDSDDASVDAGSLFAPPPPPAASAGPSLPPAPAPAPAPAPPRAGAELNRLAAPPTVATAAAATTRLRRLETTRRVKAFASVAAQSALFLAFLVVAVVLARGGNLEELRHGDLRAALGGSRDGGDFHIEDVRVGKRTLPSGATVVVVTGAVRNRSDTGVPGARVEVRFGEDDAAQPAYGWAWSSVDGIDVDALSSAEASPALSQRSPRSASLAPGERAPFVVVGPAPADGARVRIAVAAATPPPLGVSRTGAASEPAP